MQVVVRCYPKEDRAFALRVTSRVRRVPVGNARALADALTMILPGLRAAYPSLRIVVQEPIANDGTGRVVVYAYRDGHALRVPRQAPGAAPARTRLATDLDRGVQLVLLAERAIRAAERVAAAFEAARHVHLALRGMTV